MSKHNKLKTFRKITVQRDFSSLSTIDCELIAPQELANQTAKSKAKESSQSQVNPFMNLVGLELILCFAQNSFR